MNLEIEFLYQLALFFGSISLIYLLFVFFIKGRLAQARERRKAITAFLTEQVGEIVLFEKENASKKELAAFHQKKVKLRDGMSNKSKRDILVPLILKLRLELTGEPRMALIALYKELNLHLYAVQRLKSYRWEKIAAAIMELSQMEVTDAYIPIRSFINDRRAVIRKQAKAAIISLKEEGIIYFLDTTTDAISEWQQLKIIETLKSKSGFRLPEFKEWFNSPNDDVVLLALRLANTFNQKNASKPIGDLLSHKNELVKEEALTAIVKFKAHKRKPQIITAFWENPNEFKLKALHAIESMAKKKDLPFLKEVAQREQTGQIFNKAVKIIERIAPENSRKQWRVINNTQTKKAEAQKEIGSKNEQPSETKTANNAEPLVGSLSVLSKFFDHDNFHKILILDATQKLMDPKDKPLLKKIVQKEENLAIKAKALEVLTELKEQKKKGKLVQTDFKITTSR